MEVKVVIDRFVAKGHVFRQGSELDLSDLAQMGFSNGDLTRYYDAGWISIEGQPPPPEVDPNRKVTIRPEPLNLGIADPNP